ncbi:MAG: hypothetical protein OXG39_09330 [Chloroflexi bacterium]|nr:hypothetical protein [Chloroflexota bacterium]
MRIDDKQLHKLSPTQLGLYLTSNDWPLKNENDRWLVFRGDHFVDIVLAKDALAPDYPIYVDHMLKTLSSATGKAHEKIAHDIYWFDRDALTIDGDARSVAFADTQEPSIRRLIAHSANMERSLKPNFNQYYTEARKMLRHFEFSQEHNGKLRHLVDSQVGEKKAFQMEIPFEGQDPGEKLPLERRVMERIATGLFMVDCAARTQDLPSLVEGYADGFNANMCKAVLDISKYSPIPVKYSVKWSSKLPVSQGVNEVRNIQIEHSHIEFLKRARDKLRERKPEFHRIEGLVIGLSALVDPQSDDADNNERSIVVLRTDRRGPGRKLRMNLGKEDYIAAHKAHIDWKTISVGGLAIKRRSGWQLADPHEFRILR